MLQSFELVVTLWSCKTAALLGYHFAPLWFVDDQKCFLSGSRQILSVKRNFIPGCWTRILPSPQIFHCN